MTKEFEKKLYTQIKYLSTKVNYWQYLPEHDLQTAINNTMLTMLKKFEGGSVPYSTYEDYKDYMFTVLSNFVLQYFQKQDTNKNKNTVLIDEKEKLEDYAITPEEHNLYTKRIYSLINDLNQQDKELITLRIEGYTLTQISEITKLPFATVNNRIYILVHWFKEAVNSDNPPKLYKGKPYKLLDIKTNETNYFATLQAMADYLGTNRQNVAYSLKHNSLYSKRYMITKIDE